MENSSLQFMTCDQLREAFARCQEDINKRILIIDVRNSVAYEASHLTLDSRNNISSIRTKMRVMNIDPDLVTICTAKKIMSILKEADLNIFKKRRDATDVVLIDNNTDNISQLTNPKSKFMRLINALTKYDSVQEDKIVVPIKILEGGYREWLLKYPHFTTNPRFNPDDEDFFTPSAPPPPRSISPSPPLQILNPPTQVQQSQSPPRPPSPKIVDHPPTPKPVPSPPNYVTTPLRPLLIPPKSVQVVTRPLPSPPKQVQAATRPSPPLPKPVPLTPIQIKDAPGTAVPVGRSLPRSHSSPNVAQAEGDENNNKHLTAAPRFDRTLKPTSVAINTIRAQLNFGRSPEASGKAITGLQNLGNTCFMNSVIQCLSYVPPLVSYFCSGLHYNHLNLTTREGEGTKGELAIELGGLIEKLNAHKHPYIEPKSFRESIVKHMKGFAGNEQQDSHEFMMMLFDILHHDLKFNHDGKDKSIVSDLFEGMLTSTVTCTHCGTPSKKSEEFKCLSLSIPETRCSIYDCLRHEHFWQPELISGWKCDKCNQFRDAEKVFGIHRFPKILIIHLKRFSQDGRWRQKLETAVDFPTENLDVVGCRYNLLAVVNHYGGLEGGHYTAFCKLFNQNWYKFDDSKVSEIRSSNICGKAAYLLFYIA